MDSYISITSMWSDCLKHLQMTHHKEPKGRYNSGDDIRDIVVFEAGSGCEIELDVSMAHPWHGEIISKAAKKTEQKQQQQRGKRRKSQVQENECD